MASFACSYNSFLLQHLSSSPFNCSQLSSLGQSSHFLTLNHFSSLGCGDLLCLKLNGPFLCGSLLRSNLSLAFLFSFCFLGSFGLFLGLLSCLLRLFSFLGSSIGSCLLCCTLCLYPCRMCSLLAFLSVGTGEVGAAAGCSTALLSPASENGKFFSMCSSFTDQCDSPLVSGSSLSIPTQDPISASNSSLAPSMIASSKPTEDEFCLSLSSDARLDQCFGCDRFSGCQSHGVFAF